MVESKIHLVQFFQDQYGPIRERMLLAFDAQGLLILSRTCKTLHKEITSTWDINKRLLRFFDDPIPFRCKLGESDALIAGSFALQFFEGVFWRESDLDIEVQVGDNLEKMHQFMIGKGGYEISTKDNERGALVQARNPDVQDEYLGPQNSRDVVEYRTYYRMKGTTVLKAQLIATSGLPVQGILRCYYTSCLVNFITWNKAYSIFPKKTFVEHKTIPLKKLDDQKRRCYAKYRERGFELQGKPRPLTKSEFVTRVGDYYSQRRVGDRDTWMIPLDTQDITPATPSHIFETNAFSISLRTPSPPGETAWCMILAEEVSSEAVTTVFTHGGRNRWVPFHEKLRDWCLSQLQRLNPLQYEDIMRDWGFDEWPHIHVPAGWKYLDSQTTFRMVCSFVDHLQSDVNDDGIRSVTDVLRATTLSG